VRIANNIFSNINKYILQYTSIYKVVLNVSFVLNDEINVDKFKLITIR